MRRGGDVCREFEGLTLIHQNQPNLFVHEHVHDCHEVLIPLQGHCEISLVGKTWQVTPSEMFWLPLGTQHSFLGGGGELGERLILLFDEKLWKKWKGTSRAATLFPTHQLIKELSFFLMTKKQGLSDSALIDAIVSIISEAVSHHAEIDGRAHDSTLDAATKRALDTLALRFTEELSVDDLAAAAGTSSRNLSRLFSQHLGVTPKQMLIRYRVHEACRLLRDTQLSVTDVAFESGFGSLSRFIEAFRSQVGVLPSDYRGSAALQNKKI
jgi:AraC-like DNA-binding protein